MCAWTYLPKRRLGTVTVTMCACGLCVHVSVRLSDAKQSFNRLVSHQEYKALDDSSRFKQVLCTCLPVAAVRVRACTALSA